MIKPHGSDTLNPRIVDDSARADLERKATELPSIIVSSSAAASAVMLASGYFTPCDGFMSLDTALSVATNMKFPKTGLLWPTPIMNIVYKKDLPENIQAGTQLSLLDPNVPGNPILAVQDITEVHELSDADRSTIIETVFGTTDPNHPGCCYQSESLLFGQIIRTDCPICPLPSPTGWKLTCRLAIPPPCNVP